MRRAANRANKIELRVRGPGIAGPANIPHVDLYTLNWVELYTWEGEVEKYTPHNLQSLGTSCRINGRGVNKFIRSRT